MAATSLYAATVTVGGGSYTDTLPSGKTGPKISVFKTANISAPLPTTDWWTAILSSSPAGSEGRRIFAYPLAFQCDRNGLLMGWPRNYESTALNTAFNGSEDAAPYRQQLWVAGMFNSGVSTVTATNVLVDRYSDWTVTARWEDKNDATRYYTATMGQGMPFAYFEVAAEVKPRLLFPAEWGIGSLKIYDPSGAAIVAGTTDAAYERITVEVDMAGYQIYFGVFFPTGTTFSLDNNEISKTHVIDINLPTDQRYFSIGLMTAKSDLAVWKNHAFAFPTDTNVTWDVDTAASRVTTNFAVATTAKQGGPTTPILALFPHQWKNATITELGQKFRTLRGTMTCIAADHFTVTNNFNGILPFLPDRSRDALEKTELASLVTADAGASFSAYEGTYWHGKELNRTVNLLALAGQVEAVTSKNALVSALAADLADWYTYTPGETSRYFYYDHTWGGLIGFNTEFGSENFTDQHFHFGYFIYASALLNAFYPVFENNYGQMTELLIRSFASPYRDDALFPFLRSFSPYEGHSWANGMGVSEDDQINDGNNQESSSEAMNSWAGIYLWGLSTGNTTYRDLGIWGYTTEYSAIREYYFDVDDQQYGSTYGHNSVGILWGGKAHHDTWYSHAPEDIHGIQFLPVNPTSLYLGYTTNYLSLNYNELVSENGGTENSLQDIIWEMQALYNPSAALAKYTKSITYDQGNSKSFTYNWMNFFNDRGVVDTSAYADQPSFGVFSKGSTRYYVYCNPAATSATARFFRRSNDSLLGSITAPPRSMAWTSDFSSFSTEYLMNSKATAQNGGTITYYFGSWQVSISVPAGAFAQDVTLSLAPDPVTDADTTRMKMTGMGFVVTPSVSEQPSKNLTITVRYTDADAAGFDEVRLAVARYDDASGAWVVLPSNADPVANNVTAVTDHLSRFAVVQTFAWPNLRGVYVFPNPYKPGSGTSFDRAGGMVFTGLTARSKIRVYSLAAELVFEGEEEDADGRFAWNAVNNSGDKLASGVYVYLITSSSGEQKKGKLAIIK